MSKLSKLLRRPGPFVRDLLLKRYPIDFQGHVSAPMRARASVIEDVLPPRFPIDFVYTWVDDGDPEWRAQKAEYERGPEGPGGRHPEAASTARYQNHDELRYALRSVERFAPWVRRVFLVTAGHVPPWLAEHDKLSLVRHTDIIDAQHLPTFNSHVIEAHLHHIEGLSEHFVYFNDDMMLARPMQPGDFFLASGAARVSTAGRALPEGPAQRGDSPFVAASKNVRALLQRELGVAIPSHVLHGYYAQRRSALARCSELLAAHGLEFWSQRFRSTDDLNVATLMVQYLSFLEGTSVFCSTRCMYINIHSPDARVRYAALLDAAGSDASPEAICVNHVRHDLPPEQARAYEAAMRRFLQAYYPEPSAFERT